MNEGVYLVLVLAAAVVLIVVATSRFKLHPFLALLGAAYGIAFAAGMEPASIGETIRDGFGSMLGHIGMIIVLGTLIGVVLEKTGAAVTMANAVVRLIGPRFPALAMSIVGYVVSIPVFCDSGFVILSSLRRSMTRKLRCPSVSMTIALATGLYASHTLVPPTPGPIAAAGNLDLSDRLGIVLLLGLFVSSCAASVGYGWAVWAGKRYRSQEDDESHDELERELPQEGRLPSVFWAFAPIGAPILLIALGSVAALPGQPLGGGGLYEVLGFLGRPINALAIGFICSLRLLPAWNRETLSGWIEEGIRQSAGIIMITGAGGALGAVLKVTEIGATMGGMLADYHLGILLPFLIATAFKTAQGSSTVALVATSALLAPMLGDLGLESEMGRALTVMAIGAGAMTVSHANDSYFWVVSQFGGIDVGTAYKTQTVATLLQGLTAILVTGFLTLVLL